MARKKQIDSAALLEAVQSGRPAKDIMVEFGISTRIQLKSYYLDALIEAGKAQGITARQRKAKGTEKPNKIRVNKRGSLVIPKEIIDEMGFEIGQGFTVTTSKAGVSLKRV